MATRKQIRQAIHDRIKSHVKTAFPYRAAQLHTDELPIACAYFDSGNSDRDQEGTTDTEGVLVIELTATTTGDIDGYLDDLVSPIEAEMKQDPTLGGLVDLLERTGFQYDRDPESFDASLSLTYNVIYEDED